MNDMTNKADAQITNLWLHDHEKAALKRVLEKHRRSDDPHDQMTLGPLLLRLNEADTHLSLESDPWEAMGLIGSYSSAVDDQAIAVLTGIRDKLTASDIAARTGMTEANVELWQYLFCSAGWCDYGMSPRGSFPAAGVNFDELLEVWTTYYRKAWSEEPEILAPGKST